MTYVQLPGVPNMVPFVQRLWASGFGTVGTIDAATEKCAVLGRVWWPGGKPGDQKSIRNVGMYYGTVTWNNPSVWQVSLQDINTAGDPDGVADQFVTMSSAPTANTWMEHADLNSDRLVTFLDYLAVVFEWTTFAAGDSIVVRTYVCGGGMNTSGGSDQRALFYNGSDWSVATTYPSAAFRFSDGTCGTFLFSGPWSNGGYSSTLTQGSGTSEEIALRMVPELSYKIVGFRTWAQNYSLDDVIAFTIYDSEDTPIASKIVSGSVGGGGSGTDACWCDVYFSSEIELTSGSVYRLATKPTGSGDAIAVRYVEASSSAYYATSPAGPNAYYSIRGTGSAWTDTNTRWPYFIPLISSIHSGA